MLVQNHHLRCPTSIFHRPTSLLQPYLPSRISITAVSIVPYLRRRSCLPASPPGLLLCHPHHTTYLLPLVSSSSCVYSAVLITPFPSSPRSSPKFISHGPSFLLCLRCCCFCRSLITNVATLITPAISSVIFPIIPYNKLEGSQVSIKVNKLVVSQVYSKVSFIVKYKIMIIILVL